MQESFQKGQAVTGRVKEQTMEKVYYDMIYLASCGIHGMCPDRTVLGEVDVPVLYGLSHAHFMEQKGIWHLPLKGVILKEYYPSVGMRQMSDNDILFDYSFCNEVQAYMESEGYKAVSVGEGNHDIYENVSGI